MRPAAVVALLTIPLSFFLLDRVGLLFPFRSIALQVTTPVSGFIVQMVVKAEETMAVLRDFPALVRENAELSAENRRLTAELARLNDVSHENDLLRAELSLPPSSGPVTELAAFVVGRSRTGPFGTYLLNRGSADKVKVGQAVLSNAILVGRITEVFEKTSVLTPITNVNSAIPVALVESRGVGILRGGVRGLIIGEVARDVKVIPNEAVITTELGGVVPSGILVGMVESVSGNPADVFQAVSVKSSVPFNWLKLVIIREG